MINRRQNRPRIIEPTEEEVRLLIGTVAVEVADAIPENNYWGYAIATIILPEIFRGLSHTLSRHATAVGASWNYADAFMQCITGINQLFDEETHRPNATKVQGAFNVASSLQLSLLTLFSTSTFVAGPPAFAAAFFTGFVLSFDESIRCLRRWKDSDYWLKDSLAQLDKLEKLRETADRDLQEFKERLRHKPHEVGKMSNWALGEMEKRAKNYAEKIQELQSEITAYKSLEPHLAGKITRTIDKETRRIRHGEKPRKHPNTIKFLKDVNKLPDLTRKPQNLLTKSDRQKLQSYQATVDASKAKCKKEARVAMSNTAIWGCAFAGMLLLCIPGCHVFGVAVIGIASALYIVKNADRLVKKSKQIHNYFREKRKPANYQQEIEMEEYSKPKPIAPNNLVTTQTKEMINFLLNWLNNMREEFRAENSFATLETFLQQAQMSWQNGAGPSLDDIKAKLEESLIAINIRPLNVSVIEKPDENGQLVGYEINNNDRADGLRQAISQVDKLIEKLNLEEKHEQKHERDLPDDLSYGRPALR